MGCRSADDALPLAPSSGSKRFALEGALSATAKGPEASRSRAREGKAEGPAVGRCSSTSSPGGSGCGRAARPSSGPASTTTHSSVVGLRGSAETTRPKRAPSEAIARVGGERDGEGGSETASSSRARSPGQSRRPTPQHSLGGSMATAVMAARDQRGEWTLSGCELKLVVRAGHTKRRGHDGSSSEMEGCKECRWMGWLRVGMSV
jgi:hypothetical protein